MGDDAGALVSALESRTECQSSIHANGARLICHQPWRGKYAYLHVIYPGLKGASLEELTQILGGDLPPSLRDFYASMNGLQLFEGLLNVDGLVVNFSRIPGEFQPFCPKTKVSLFHSTHPSWHQLYYVPIGSWLGYSRRAIIACNKRDHIVVFDDKTGEPIRQYQDIFSALRMLTAEMDPLWQSDGKLCVPEKSLDAALVAPGSA